MSSLAERARVVRLMKMARVRVEELALACADHMMMMDDLSAELEAIDEALFWDRFIRFCRTPSWRFRCV